MAMSGAARKVYPVSKLAPYVAEGLFVPGTYAHGDLVYSGATATSRVVALPEGVLDLQ